MRVLNKKIMIFFLTALLTVPFLTGSSLPPCKRININDGLGFLFFRDQSSAVSVVQIFIRGGKSGEPEGKRGLALITTGLTLTIPDAAPARKLMELGAIFSSQVNEDDSLITIKCLSQNLRETLEILTPVIKKPLLSTLRIKNIKKDLESRQKSEQEDPDQLVDLTVRNTFFPDSVYSGSIYGDPDSLKKIKKKDVVDFHAKYMNTANMTLSIASDLDEAQIKKIINNCFSGFPTGETVQIDPVKVSARAGEKRQVNLDKEQKQVLTCFAFLLPPITPDQFALTFVLEDLVGKGTGSRLWRLRWEHELTYGLAASLSQFRHAGILKIYVKTGSEKKEKAYHLLNTFVTDLRNSGIGGVELETAKTHAKAEFLRMNETGENRALHHGYFEISGLGSGFIEDLFRKIDHITLEQINEYIKKVFAPGNMAVVRIGPGL